MPGHDYLQLQNQGNIISNIYLLDQMDLASDMADSQGYYSKRSVAIIGVSSLIITSGSKVGDEVAKIVDATGDSSRNSPLQNAKARMQILRVLGLVSADYGSETYAITRVGKLVLSQFRQNPRDYRLLRELFLGISTSTETYEHNCSDSFNCCLGYGICYAFSRLDYRISTDEMPLLTAYDIREINSFVRDARLNREKGSAFSGAHSHFPKTSQGTPLKNPSNLTRSINQILRICRIVKQKTERIGSKNYYVCTEEGKAFVDEIRQRFSSTTFLTAAKFRKKNNIVVQRAICNDAFNTMLYRSGICNTPPDCNIAFSPYQMLPETSAEWFLGGKIRRHPDSDSARISTINSSVTARDLRISAEYNKAASFQDVQRGEIKAVADRVRDLANDGRETRSIAQIICEEHKEGNKQKFYPFIHSLLRIIGLDCKGEVGRFDAYCKFNDHVIPVEIKSFGEAPTYTAKGIRQAIENKIMSFSGDLENDLDYATMVIGFGHPENDSESRLLIDQAYSYLKIKIIAADLFSVVHMAVLRIVEGKAVDLEKLLMGFGILVD